MSLIPEIETLKSKLQLERNKMLDRVKTFSEEELLQVPPGGWSVKDILAHVASAEEINVKFARLMLEADGPIQIEAVRADYPDYAGAFDLDRFNAYMTDKLRRQSLATVLQRLTETRAETLAWLETLTPQDLTRRGTHAAWSEQSVRGMVKILMLHDKTHTQEIAKRASQ